MTEPDTGVESAPEREEKGAAVAVEEPPGEIVLAPTSWEFFEPPTTDEVKAKLATLPDVWGVKHGDFWEYVQPLSQRKNISQDDRVKEYRVVWTLYFTVAGRLSMVNQAAILNDWSVDFEPEPGGVVPGYLLLERPDGDDNGRIVYREFVVIRSGGDRLLGRRPGTAWVPYVGGGGAVGTNRFEKLETAARGRALAAWGFGVLPGSGVASLEEMQLMQEHQRTEGQPQTRGRRSQAPQPTRDDQEGDMLLLLAQYQEVSGVSDETLEEKVNEFLARTFDKKVERVAGTGVFDLRPLKDGELSLFKTRITKEVERIRNEAPFE